MAGKGRAKPRRSPGNRAGLDVARIVAAARTLAPSSLSMQAVANVLGVDRSALHHHVVDRANLLALVAEDAFATDFSAVSLAAHGDWRAACRAYGFGFAQAVFVTGAYMEHLRPQHVLGTRFVETTETLLSTMTAAGFDDEVAVRGLAMLTNLCYAYARDLNVKQSDESRIRANMLAQSLSLHERDRFAHLARIARLGIDTYGPDQLAFSLDTFVEGFAASLPGDASRDRSG